MLFFLLLLTCIEQNSCTIFCHFAQEIMFKYLKHRTVQTFSYLFAKSNSALLYCPLRDSMSAPISGAVLRTGKRASPLAPPSAAISFFGCPPSMAHFF